MRPSCVQFCYEESIINRRAVLLFDCLQVRKEIRHNGNLYKICKRQVGADYTNSVKHAKVEKKKITNLPFFLNFARCTMQ